MLKNSLNFWGHSNDEADKKDREKMEEERKFYEEIMKKWREEK